MGISIKSVREFIYLDVPRLYSLSSQLYEGVSDRIVDEAVSLKSTTDAQSTVLKQATAESRSLEEYRQIKTTILHDHMYNRLERTLQPVGLASTEVDLAQISHKIQETPIIKVTGRAEIEDYERLNLFLERFNELGEAIAYASLSSDPDTAKKKRELERELGRAGTNSESRNIKRKLHELMDTESRAREAGLWQDPQLLSNLKLFGDLFNPEGYNIVITQTDTPRQHFRGVLDKQWLRTSPQLLRGLCGGQSEAPWSMVGMVTHVPGTYKDLREDEAETQLVQRIRSEEENELSPMMLDNYRRLFRTARSLERTFLESNTDVEIVMSPLAIYREFLVSAVSDETC